MVDYPLTSLKSGYLNQTGTCPCPQQYRVYKGIGTHTANFAWDFYAKAPRNDRKVLMELTDEVNQKLTVTLKFGENGYIGYNSAGIWYNIMPYDPNTWYEFSVINVNFAASQYDLMINGVVVGTNLGFYQSASRITHITFVGDSPIPAPHGLMTSESATRPHSKSLSNDGSRFTVHGFGLPPGGKVFRKSAFADNLSSSGHDLTFFSDTRLMRLLSSIVLRSLVSGGLLKFLSSSLLHQDDPAAVVSQHLFQQFIPDGIQTPAAQLPELKSVFDREHQRLDG